MSQHWKEAAALLRKAADTIEARSRLRDAENEPDLIDVTAEISGTDADTVLDVLVALKVARFERAHDFDSAVDQVAYQARALVSRIAHAKPAPPVLVPFDDEEPPLRASVTAADDRF